MNNRSIIEIELSRKYITKMMAVTDLEAMVLREMRRLRNRGHDTLIIRIGECQAVVSAICKENGQNGRNGV